jgi:hypothetical protein
LATASIDDGIGSQANRIQDRLTKISLFEPPVVDACRPILPMVVDRRPR